MTTIVFDLDGVVYLGDEVVPGATRVLEWCRSEGMRPLFVTNNSVRTPQQVVEKVERVAGFSTEPDEVITSALAAADLVARRGGRRALVVGERGIVEALEDQGVVVTTDPEQCDHVVVGLSRSVTYDLLSAATAAVRNGATLIASNLDATFPTPRGLRPGAGSLVAAVETSTDVIAIPAGKPFAPIRKLIADRSVGEVMVVGDRPDTDIALGIAEGWPTFLCLTGVIDDPGAVPARFLPTAVLDSVADLPDAVARLRA